MDSHTATRADSPTTLSRNSQISERVVSSVARAKGVDPLDLEPLYDVVDPDALDALFSSDGSSAATGTELTFTMAGCEVRVHGDGAVDVTPPASDGGSLSVVHLDDQDDTL